MPIQLKRHARTRSDHLRARVMLVIQGTVTHVQVCVNYFSTFKFRTELKNKHRHIITWILMSEHRCIVSFSNKRNYVNA